jgi:hypothetical protein
VLFAQREQRVGRVRAALAVPGLKAFTDGDGGDQQADDRVKPPGAERGVREQTGQQGAPAR